MAMVIPCPGSRRTATAPHNLCPSQAQVRQRMSMNLFESGIALGGTVKKMLENFCAATLRGSGGSGSRPSFERHSGTGCGSIERTGARPTRSLRR